MVKSTHSSLLFFFSSILVSFIALSVAQQDFSPTCQNNNGNYTSNSAFGTNLNSVLSSISSNTVIDYGFYNESVGQEPDMVNAIALCRGDASVDVCRSCLQNATQKILEVCPNQKEAVGWDDNCMLRYSNKSIFSTVEKLPTIYMVNTQNVTENLNQALQDLLGTLRDTAASGDSHRKFDTGDITSEFQRIYALVQCTPDLDQQECIDCLDDIIAQIPTCCSNKRGGRVLNPSCNFIFEVNNRLFNSTPDSPSATPPAPPTGNDNTAQTVIIIVVPIVSVVILAICIFFVLRLRKRKTKPEETTERETFRLRRAKLMSTMLLNSSDNDAPTRKRAIIWYDECMLQYSNVSFFGRAETSTGLMMWNIRNTTSPDGQNYGALALIYSLIGEAPYTNMMFGTVEKVVANRNQHGYALVQ
ncbi:hypothetical protein EZV62_026489 [Acer yangbiense]|uniref:Gnk2-homologous domain-containing protein n=1 Tax=Acer yangbiense TaxID=1000413 RepID=A0A5C7GRJ9_9ROSI|nr:hypothetical protein EZV62_026489 [Acer yangbiense]